MNRWLFFWRQLNRKLWVRASLYAMLGVAVAIAAVVARPVVPAELARRFGGESVEAILTILASSMLAVTTFSLGAMVTAYTAVSQAASPRVSQLVTGDPMTQKALATFVGAFLYAVVGVTAINAGYYGAEGRAVIFFCSLAVVGLVAFRLLSWVDRLSRLARVGHMIELVEGLTREAMAQQARAPVGRADDTAFARGRAVLSRETGYVQNVDWNDLDDIACQTDGRIQVVAPPGRFVRVDEPLCRLSAKPADEGLAERVRRAFSVGATRSFDQDARYGLVVLGEIAGKALSPGINDPGTAVQVIATAVRLMDEWARLEWVADPACRVVNAPLAEADMLDDVFGPTMRYGGEDFVVAARLQKALRSLAAAPGPLAQAARTLADEALDRSRRLMGSEADRARLDAAART